MMSPGSFGSFPPECQASPLQGRSLGTSLHLCNFPTVKCVGNSTSDKHFVVFLIASYPGPAQFSITSSMVKKERVSGIFSHLSDVRIERTIERV